ncbi:hypothetical protein JYK22_21580, partial [Nonomuraea sp. RK-328]|nr:hypothetical protein [Nonomuraea sp. RK-328]
MGDYEKTYNDFWKDLVENEDGSLNRDQVMRELSDYHHLLEQAAEVYSHVTGGRISKTNTIASAVTAVADERIDEIVNAEIRDREELSASPDSSTEEGSR